MIHELHKKWRFSGNILETVHNEHICIIDSKKLFLFMLCLVSVDPLRSSSVWNKPFYHVPLDDLAENSAWWYLNNIIYNYSTYSCFILVYTNTQSSKHVSHFGLARHGQASNKVMCTELEYYWQQNFRNNCVFSSVSFTEWRKLIFIVLQRLFWKSKKGECYWKNVFSIFILAGIRDIALG